MTSQNWLITGVSSGFGRELATQLLGRGDTVVGTVRRPGSVADLRAQGGGRIIQMSTYGGQVAFPGNSMYHATKWGIEGFAESVAQEVAPFGIGVTIVEPGGARTEFRYGSAQVAQPLPAYDGNPAHGFLAMLDPANGLAPGDPARMAAAIIASAAQEPAPMRLILGAQALKTRSQFSGTASLASKPRAIWPPRRTSRRAHDLPDRRRAPSE